MGILPPPKKQIRGSMRPWDCRLLFSLLIQGILAWLHDILWKQRSSKRFPELVCLLHSSHFWFLLQLQFCHAFRLPCPPAPTTSLAKSLNSARRQWRRLGLPQEKCLARHVPGSCKGVFFFLTICGKLCFALKLDLLLQQLSARAVRWLDQSQKG